MHNSSKCSARAQMSCWVVTAHRAMYHSPWLKEITTRRPSRRGITRGSDKTVPTLIICSPKVNLQHVDGKYSLTEDKEENILHFSGFLKYTHHRPLFDFKSASWCFRTGQGQRQSASKKWQAILHSFTSPKLFTIKENQSSKVCVVVLLMCLIDLRVEG